MKTETTLTLILAILFLVLSSSCINEDITATETVSTTLQEGSNAVRFPEANLLIHINYDADENEYEIFIPQLSSTPQTVVAGRASISASFPASNGDLTLTIEEDTSTTAEGRQKNRRVEMTIIFN